MAEFRNASYGSFKSTVLADILAGEPTKGDYKFASLRVQLNFAHFRPRIRSYCSPEIALFTFEALKLLVAFLPAPLTHRHSVAGGR